MRFDHALQAQEPQLVQGGLPQRKPGPFHAKYSAKSEPVPPLLVLISSLPAPCPFRAAALRGTR